MCRLGFAGADAARWCRSPTLFHATRAAFERDRRGDTIHVRAGYLVLRTTWHELTNKSHALIARIAEALARREQPYAAIVGQ